MPESHRRRVKVRARESRFTPKVRKRIRELVLTVLASVLAFWALWIYAGRIG